MCVTVSHCQEGPCKVRLHQHTQRVQIKGDLGIPWQSRGSDSELPPQGAQVQSLVKELRSHMPCGTDGQNKSNVGHSPAQPHPGQTTPAAPCLILFTTKTCGIPRWH